MQGDLKSFWLSWYCAAADYGKFELHWPWWVSGERLSDNALTICAAVQAETTDDAMKIIENCYDAPTRLEWRFCEVRGQDWSPYSGRFPKADWMKWPDRPVTDPTDGGGS